MADIACSGARCATACASPTAWSRWNVRRNAQFRAEHAAAGVAAVRFVPSRSRNPSTMNLRSVFRAALLPAVVALLLAACQPPAPDEAASAPPAPAAEPAAPAAAEPIADE